MGKVYLAFVGGGHAGLKDGKSDRDATAGKETPYIKSLGRRIQEEEFNEPVSEMIREALVRAGVHVYDPAPGHTDVPLKTRTDFANKIYKEYCDKYGEENVICIYLSVHFNAYDGSFSGANPSGQSLFVYPGYRYKGAGKLAESIAKHLKGGTPQEYRGIKEANFHILRETDMTAVLTENGFMDHEREALLMIDKDFQKEVAVEHAKGICDYFGVNYVPEPKPTGVFYRVVTGSFADRENAEKRVSELNKAGFKSFIAAYKEEK